MVNLCVSGLFLSNDPRFSFLMCFTNLKKNYGETIWKQMLLKLVWPWIAGKHLSFNYYVGHVALTRSDLVTVMQSVTCCLSDAKLLPVPILHCHQLTHHEEIIILQKYIFKHLQFGRSSRKIFPNVRSILSSRWPISQTICNCMLYFVSNYCATVVFNLFCFVLQKSLTLAPRAHMYQMDW